jgi:hypothetical protein
VWAGERRRAASHPDYDVARPKTTGREKFSEEIAATDDGSVTAMIDAPEPALTRCPRWNACDQG